MKQTAWSNRIVGHGEADPRTLVPHPDNWRTHTRAQRRALGAVLDRVGWVATVIVSRQTDRILNGHLRVEQAKANGEERIPVTYVDVDEAEEGFILATFDPLGSMASADADAFRTVAAQLSGEDAAVQELLREVATAQGVALDEPAAGLSEPDEVPPLAVPVSVPGDIWHLGDHRLLCGDATDGDAVLSLLAGERAEAMWTDPPYGVDYEGGTEAHLRIANDDASGLAALLAAAFPVADLVLADGASLYVASPAGPNAACFIEAFVRAGWHLHQNLIWVKDGFVLGHSDYHYQHEPILYGWKKGGHRWYGGRARSSVFEVPRPTRSVEHPTMKPVALVEAQLANSTVRGALVYDPFAGSGTTLLAAERLQRRCVAVELDPRYVDVIVRRWQAYTGADARHADGRRFAEVEEARRAR